MKRLGRFLRKLIKWTLLVFGGLTVLGIILGVFFAEPLTEEAKATREAARIEAQLKNDVAKAEREAIKTAEKATRDAELAETKARQEAEELAKQEAQLAAKKEETRKGFHCLSAWDGSHSNFKRDVKSKMRDPDSFEHISTRVAPISDAGTHAILMEYRARNGFGGMNVGTAGGVYQNSNCSHTVISVD